MSDSKFIDCRSAGINPTEKTETEERRAQLEIADIFPDLKEPEKRKISKIILEIGAADTPGFLNSNKRLPNNTYWITLDIAPHFVERCQMVMLYSPDKNRVEALLGDGMNTNFKNDELDEVVMTNVISDLLTKDEVVKMIAEAIRIVRAKKDGGKIVLNETINPSSRRGTFLAFRKLDELEELIKKRFGEAVDLEELTFAQGEGWDPDKYGVISDETTYQIIITKK